MRDGLTKGHCGATTPASGFQNPGPTGITGTTDIEVLEGLSLDEEIVTGPYQALRTIQDNAKIKVETPAAEKKP